MLKAAEMAELLSWVQFQLHCPSEMPRADAMAEFWAEFFFDLQMENHKLVKEFILKSRMWE